MKTQAGAAIYDFHAFRSLEIDHDRIIAALSYGNSRFLPGFALQVEVEVREVERAPVQDYWFPEPSMTPDEFSRLAREAGAEFVAAPEIHPETVHELSRRLAELVRSYQDVRFTQGKAPVGGAFRPGLITIYVVPEVEGEALTNHLISALAHETFHAASFRVADRRRGVLRQHLSYQDERGFQLWEEIMACLYAQEVCERAGCAGEAAGGPVTPDFLRLGREVLARLGEDFAGMSGWWLLTRAGAEQFWDGRGDLLFRSLHLHRTG
ncbi:MAG: hypothetical protein ACM3RP_13550 [Chitinophagales bacterium]